MMNGRELGEHPALPPNFRVSPLAVECPRCCAPSGRLCGPDGAPITWPHSARTRLFLHPDTLRELTNSEKEHQ